MKEILQQAFADTGFKSSIISTRHLPELKFDLENLREQGILRKDFYNEIVSRYELHFNCELPVDFPTAQSIIITAAPQPRYRVEFKWSGKTYPAIIPPTYLHHTDKEVLAILSLHSGNHGYSVYETELPAKLIAVRCGLAKYGRNNIAYIDGWGSFFRLRAFFSDMPCDADNWQELKMMDRCNACTACVKNCPTRAITKERFLVNAGQCLTFFNEGTRDFPEWLDPAWHNCLIGCMRCQDICPENKDFSHWIEDVETFSEDETSKIIEGVPAEKLPGKVIDKLKKIYLWKDYHLLQRNLSMLIK